MSRATNSNPYKRHKRAPFQYPPDWASVLTANGQQVVQILGMGKTPELGPDVVLYLRYLLGYNTAMHIDLTRFTELELDAFKQLVLETVELARPIVQFRDKVAHDNAEQGDDSDPRVYREVPNLVRRAWARDIDAQSVLQRLEDIPQRPEPGEHSARGTRPERGPLVEPDAQASEPQDDSAQAD